LAASHVVFEASVEGMKLEKLPARIFSPYSGEYWAPYLTKDVLHSLVSALEVNLDDDDEIVFPSVIGKLPVAVLYEQHAVGGDHSVKAHKSCEKGEGNPK